MAVTILERIAAKPIVTAAELALLIGVSVYTIRRATRAGQIPSLRVGGSRRYSRVDAIRAMKHRAEGGATASNTEQCEREPADA
jgi:excisionase family DNA binding protein